MHSRRIKYGKLCILGLLGCYLVLFTEPNNIINRHLIGELGFYMLFLELVLVLLIRDYMTRIYLRAGLHN